MVLYYVAGLKSAILVSLTIMNLITNSLVITVIVRNPQLLDDRMTLFMLSLSVSDLASGCTFMPMSAILCHCDASGPFSYLPKVQFFFMTWFVSTSWLGVLGVTVTKTITIIRPLRCRDIMTPRRCYAVIVWGWMICLCQAVLNTALSGNVTCNVDMCSYRLPINKNYSTLFATLVVLSSGSLFLLLAYSSAHIFVVVLRAHKQIAALARSMGRATGSDVTANNLTRRSVRSARNIFIICVTAMTLASPLVLFSITRNVLNSYWVSKWFGFVAMALFDCNTFMDGLLYVFLYRSVRRKMRRLLTELFYRLSG